MLTLEHRTDKCVFGDFSVMSYAVAPGVLTLRHEYPQASRDRALVDVRLLLETLTANQVQVGEWVNVIGYVNRIVPAQSTKFPTREAKCKDVHVQALILWSTGPLDIQDYERCLGNWASNVDT
ncbi:hypothetical protein CMQ_6100 [Grosmannia clavigera kw1407]|uniref:Uncharacterized protein n=1 Tax=Grosmannia clavigera (strain kw1407 / UAMH 11150) TaxID=655863 RepID=F0XLP2_GROCL|nr:uncharacterized protein CMQ_6100 [Grosmannia clavigera kw1407]EFX01158.1 hypothetical protein CMQ_6100 [Grosmannia clavigera kw1407]